MNNLPQHPWKKDTWSNIWRTGGLMAFPLPDHNQWAVSMRVPPFNNLVYAVGETHGAALANWYAEMGNHYPDILAALRIVHDMPEVQE